jgi:hypothetical protein
MYSPSLMPTFCYLKAGPQSNSFAHQNLKKSKKRSKKFPISASSIVLGLNIVGDHGAFL